MVQQALNGYNVMIAAFGQTSSGKTHTIRGCDKSPGIIVLTARELFRGIANLQQEEKGANQKLTISMEASYLEIYNESVNDLLDERKKNLEVRDYRGDVYVDQLTERKVTKE